MRLAWPLVVSLSVIPAFAQYAGPAILSRGDAPAPMTSTQVDFRPFVNVAGVYTAGLSGLFAGSQGPTLGNLTSAGLLLSFGVSGLHSWKHTKLGLDYVGSITRYSNNSIYGNFQNQSFLLSLAHQLTPHVTFQARENAAVSSQPLSSPGLPSSVSFDPSLAYNPTTDFYDNRTIFLTSSANLIVQKSARLSFDFGGMGSLTERQGAGLYSVTGAGATGDVQYRISSHTTIGATYNYMHFVFHGTFNATDVQTLAGSYSKRLTRSLEFTGYGGVARTQSKFLTPLPISPILAGLIGLTQATVITYSSLNHPTYNVRLSQTFQRGVVFLASSYTVTPGNGLFLTSTALAASMGYNYTGLKLWSLGVTASYSRAHSISNVIGEYGGDGLTFAATRKIKSYFYLICSLNGTQYSSSSFAGYNRLIYTANIGVAFSPGNIPLRVW